MAVRTSTQAGNLSAAATWGGTNVATGDTLVIAHAVTADVNFDVGTSGASGTVAITVNTPGSFTVNNSITATVRGDVLQNDAVITLGNGVTITLDASAASSPSTTHYKWQIGNGDSQLVTRLVSNGTSGAPNVIQSHASGGNIYITDGANRHGGLTTATWTTFRRLGYAGQKAWSWYPLYLRYLGADDSFNLTDCTFDTSGGVVQPLANLPDGVGASFVRVTWVNSVTGDTGYNLNYDGNALASVLADRIVDDCRFDLAFGDNAPSLVVTNSVMASYAGTSSAVKGNNGRDWNTNLILSVDANIQLPFGYTKDHIVISDIATGNPHFAALPTTADATLDGAVFEHTREFSDGDGASIGTPPAAQTYLVKNCIGAGNAVGLQSGTIVNISGNANASVAIEHCSFLTDASGGGPGITIGETYNGHVGEARYIKSCLAIGSPNGTSYAIQRLGSGNVQDICQPEDFDYHFFQNLDNGSDGYGVNATSGPTVFSRPTWGAHDKLGNAQCVDLTVGITKWDYTLSSAVSRSITSITRSGAVATVTRTAHGYRVGDWVLIAGANETAYNGQVRIATVPDANTFTYAVAGSPASPATGTLLITQEGTYAHAKAAIYARTAGYSVAALLAYYRAGWTPRNPALKGQAHDGGDIGAVAVQYTAPQTQLVLYPVAGSDTTTILRDPTTLAGPAAALAASVTSQSTATAALTTAVRLAANVTSASTATGSLTTAIRLAAAVTSASTTSGSLTTAIRLATSVTSASTATGALTTAIRLAASVTTASTASASLTVPKPLAASVTSASTASGVLATSIRLAALVTSGSTASGVLTATIRLAASITSGSAATGSLTVPKPLAASVTSGSTASASLTTAIRLASSVTSGSTASGVLTTSIKLASSVTSSSTATAALTTAIRLVASAMSVSTATGALSVPKPLAASVTSGSSASASLTTSVRLAASVASASSASGSLTSAIRLAAAPTSGSSAVAALTTAIRLLASIATASVAVAALTVPKPLAASVASASTATASLTTAIRLSASVTSGSTASGALATSIRLAASVTSGSTASGALSSAIRFAADVASTSTALGNLTIAKPLAAFVASTSSATASLLTTVRLAASVSGSSTATGALTAVVRLAASVTSASNATAALSTSIRLAASVNSTSTATGSITGGALLSASVASDSSSSGALTVPKPLMAAVSASSSASGVLTTRIALAGSVVAASTASAALSTTITLAASVTSASAAAASLNTTPAGADLLAVASSTSSALASLSAAIRLAAAAASNSSASASLSTTIRLRASVAGTSSATGTLLVGAVSLAASVASGSGATGTLTTSAPGTGPSALIAVPRSGPRTIAESSSASVGERTETTYAGARSGAHTIALASSHSLPELFARSSGVPSPQSSIELSGSVSLTATASGVLTVPPPPGTFRDEPALPMQSLLTFVVTSLTGATCSSATVAGGGIPLQPGRLTVAGYAASKPRVRLNTGSGLTEVAAYLEPQGRYEDGSYRWLYIEVLPGVTIPSYIFGNAGTMFAGDVSFTVARTLSPLTRTHTGWFQALTAWFDDPTLAGRPPAVLLSIDADYLSKCGAEPYMLTRAESEALPNGVGAQMATNHAHFDTVSDHFWAQIQTINRANTNYTGAPDGHVDLSNANPINESNVAASWRFGTVPDAYGNLRNAMGIATITHALMWNYYDKGAMYYREYMRTGDLKWVVRASTHQWWHNHSLRNQSLPYPAGGAGQWTMYVNERQSPGDLSDYDQFVGIILAMGQGGGIHCGVTGDPDGRVYQEAFAYHQRANTYDGHVLGAALGTGMEPRPMAYILLAREGALAITRPGSEGTAGVNGVERMDWATSMTQQVGFLTDDGSGASGIPAGTSMWNFNGPPSPGWHEKYWQSQGGGLSRDNNNFAIYDTVPHIGYNLFMMAIADGALIRVAQRWGATLGPAQRLRIKQVVEHQMAFTYPGEMWGDWGNHPVFGSAFAGVPPSFRNGFNYTGVQTPDTGYGPVPDIQFWWPMIFAWLAWQNADGGQMTLAKRIMGYALAGFDWAGTFGGSYKNLGEAWFNGYTFPGYYALAASVTSPTTPATDIVALVSTSVSSVGVAIGATNTSVVATPRSANREAMPPATLSVVSLTPSVVAVSVNTTTGVLSITRLTAGSGSVRVSSGAFTATVAVT